MPSIERAEQRQHQQQRTETSHRTGAAKIRKQQDQSLREATAKTKTETETTKTERDSGNPLKQTPRDKRNPYQAECRYVEQNLLCTSVEQLKEKV